MYEATNFLLGSLIDQIARDRVGVRLRGRLIIRSCCLRSRFWATTAWPRQVQAE